MGEVRLLPFPPVWGAVGAWAVRSESWNQPGETGSPFLCLFTGKEVEDVRGERTRPRSAFSVSWLTPGFSGQTPAVNTILPPTYLTAPGCSGPQPWTKVKGLMGQSGTSWPSLASSSLVSLARKTKGHLWSQEVN